MTDWLAYPCVTDAVVYLVSAVDPHIGLLHTKIECPLCKTPLLVQSGSDILFTHKPDVVVKTIAAIDLFKAANGLGFPSEQDASLERVTHILLGSVIKNVTVEDFPPTKTIITSMSVEQPLTGLTYNLYLATSTKGVVIYKIEAMPC